MNIPRHLYERSIPVELVCAAGATVVCGGGDGEANADTAAELGDGLEMAFVGGLEVTCANEVAELACDNDGAGETCATDGAVVVRDKDDTLLACDNDVPDCACVKADLDVAGFDNVL